MCSLSPAQPNDIILPLISQATFLTPAAGSEKAANHRHDSALLADFEALTDEEVVGRCRRNGLSRAGGRSAMHARLAALDHYLHGDSKPTGGFSGDQHFPTLGPVSASPAVKAEVRPFCSSIGTAYCADCIVQHAGVRCCVLSYSSAYYDIMYMRLGAPFTIIL